MPNLIFTFIKFAITYFVLIDNKSFFQVTKFVFTISKYVYCYGFIQFLILLVTVTKFVTQGDKNNKLLLSRIFRALSFC